MLGGPQPGRTAPRPSWPPLELPPPPPAHQPADAFGRYGVYSLFPGDVYAAAAPRYAAPTQYHGLLPPPPPLKECVFSTYTGAGPGSPYSAPVVERGISQLQELMAKSKPVAPLAAAPADRPRPKRRAWEPAEVKQEAAAKPSCACRTKTSPTGVVGVAVSPGCSRTTPVALKPQPQVKREPPPTPAPLTPCQVAEVTTSAVKVKQEVPDLPPSGVSVAAQSQGGIPVGIAVARQRQEVRVKEDPVMPPLVLACERPTNQLPFWVPPPAVATPPHFWPAPIEQNLPLQPPVGYQLARDPVSGQLLLISTPATATANIADSMQRTIVWPNTSSFPPPPLLLPPTQPMTGHLLLATPPPAPTPDKRRAPPHGLLKIEDPSSLSGVMPCAKSSVVIQQLSTHSPQFSAIASSGSVLIQHISGANSVPPSLPLLPPQSSASVLISAQQLTTEAQSLMNAQHSPSLVISHSHSQQDSVISPHHMLSQPLPLVLGTDFLRQPDPQIHLQLKESPKEEVMEEIPEPVEEHVEEKVEPIIGCRSQATSPVPCLSPVVDCQSQSQSEDEGAATVVTVSSQPSTVQQADASNQTDSLPPSSDDDEAEETEEAEPTENIVDTKDATPVDINVATPADIKVAISPDVKVAIATDADVSTNSATSAVDLSGLELLSAASMEQIERSHSAPLAEVAKIKTEVEEDEEPPPEEVVVKEEAEAPEEEEPTIAGGLGLLCDVAHRFIEEEEALSRPQSPADDIDDKSTGEWCEEEVVPRRVPLLYRPESPCDPAELEMRERLAQLQQLYREKQRELSRLSTTRKSLSGDTPSMGSEPSACRKRGPGRPRKRTRSSSPPTSPPVLEPWSAEKCPAQPGALPPPTLTPHKAAHRESDTQQWEVVSPPSLSPAQSPSSASKKRKVGRPKKREDHGSLTIVAKKPHSKSSLVGLLLAKKQLARDDDSEHPHKIRPKLKAEVKVKSWCEGEEEEMEWTSQPPRRHSDPVSPSAATPGRPVKSKSLPTPTPSPVHKKPIMVLAKRKRASSSDQPPQKSSPQPLHAQGVTNCQLTAEHLAPDSLPCRVLVAMGGLFYAGQLSAVRPPDLYGVTLDGERSHRPHIHSREEILKDSILEVCTSTVPPPGTRVCAYWSQQYRCLYPGTVPTPSADDADCDPRLVCVEFDDGDNGRISLEDIRLLPQDYPVVVYDPNPLQSLGKRRRRNSGASCDSQSKEKSLQVMEAVAEVEEAESKAEACEEPSPCPEPVLEQTEPSAEVLDTTSQLSAEAEAAERERRRLKKIRRKEKLRRLEGEKRHRHKHRDCLKTHRHKHKHRHHRRKHRHSKTTDGVAVENQSGELEENGPLKLIVHTTPPVTTNNVPTNPPLLSTIKLKKDKKKKRAQERQNSVESRSKMAAFLPARQLWRWAGRSYKRPGAKGRARKDFYRSIQRDNETISVGDCAVFLSTGRPDRPFIGRIESMWQSWGSSMVVKVRWFYHPEETVGCPEHMPYPGALFESPHNDENDVQTISHKCEVLPLDEYKYRLSLEPHRIATIYADNDIYYLAGYYDPTNLSLRFEPGVQ